MDPLLFALGLFGVLAPALMVVLYTAVPLVMGGMLVVGALSPADHRPAPAPAADRMASRPVACDTPACPSPAAPAIQTSTSAS